MSTRDTWKPTFVKKNAFETHKKNSQYRSHPLSLKHVLDKTLLAETKYAFVPRATIIHCKIDNGILGNWESLCDIRPDCHHHFDASGSSTAMFDRLAKRSLTRPLPGRNI